MTTLLLFVLFALGLIGGFFSGLLGIGGGIIMVPLLLYVPSLIGLEAIPMKTAAAITIVQSMAGSFSGLMVHKKNDFVHTKLIIYMGSGVVLGSLVGSFFSKQIQGEVMLGIFAGMALIATVLMYIPRKKDDDLPVENVELNKFLAFFVALLVGILGGIVGQGGAFILIPLMLYVLKIPTRIALGSSVAITFLSALAGFIGKWGTGQIPFVMAIVLVVGALIGAQLGGRLSNRLQTASLRTILSAVITITALKMWFELNPIVGYLLTIGSVLFLLVFFLNGKRKQKNPDSSNITLKT
ncbi:sulfite exporter TauE/SafE family protein [Desulfosporosinus sp. SB140]|uniref:sulfite exporter TauE/SafE family protein n=1 Tax=Desulfosporosinus paludis TaxID=3115649 RepID=UPI003890CBF2